MPLRRQLGERRDGAVWPRPRDDNLGIGGLAQRAAVVVVADAQPQAAPRADLWEGGQGEVRASRGITWALGHRAVRG